ncbi:MAG TPA: TIGR03936 family radical SAM-associated protein [Mycobacteriales bacterium]
MSARRSPQPEGPPPPAVVQRIRLRYAKRGRLRFTSHRDVARLLERAVRRAGLPVAHSAGFTPHPKISWLGASPTGVASEAEYVEIGLTTALDPADVRARLDASLPPDLDILDAVVAGPGALADRLEASSWRLRLPGVQQADAEHSVAAFLAESHVLVSRRTKDGTRELDARAAVVSLTATPPESGGADQPCAILHAVVRHTTPVVRPDDVLAALRAVAALELEAPMVATRLAQGPLHGVREDGAAGPASVTVSDPLEPDRAAGEPGPAETVTGPA